MLAQGTVDLYSAVLYSNTENKCRVVGRHVFQHYNIDRAIMEIPKIENHNCLEEVEN